MASFAWTLWRHAGGMSPSPTHPASRSRLPGSPLPSSTARTHSVPLPCVAGVAQGPRLEKPVSPFLQMQMWQNQEPPSLPPADARCPAGLSRQHGLGMVFESPSSGQPCPARPGFSSSPGPNSEMGIQSLLGSSKGSDPAM